MSKPKPPADFDDNPEWTEDDFGRAKAAEELHAPHVVSAPVRKRGRPVGSTKRQIALRLDTDVADSFRDSGPGWQTRMNEALRTRVDVAYSQAVNGWLVSVNRPIAGVAGRAHDIIGKFKTPEEARNAADHAAAREPGNAKVAIWPAA